MRQKVFFRVLLVQFVGLASLSVSAQELENKLYATNLECVVGAESTLKVYLENEITITGVQCDMYLPEGVTIKTIGRTGSTPVITLGSARFEGLVEYSLASATQDDGSLRLLIVNTANIPIWDDDIHGADIRKTEPLLTIDIVGISQPGVYDVQIKNIVVTHYDDNGAVKYEPKDAAFTITVRPGSGNASGSVGDVFSIASAAGSEITKSYFENAVDGISDKDNVAIVDLRAANLASDISSASDLTSGLEDNVLVFLPDDASISGTNIVVDGECSSLKMTDGKIFDTKTDFNAVSVNYDRNFTTNWQTICVPFDYVLPSGVIAEELQEIDLDNNIFTFTSVSKLKANVPYILKNGSATAALFSNLTNVSVLCASSEKSVHILEAGNVTTGSIVGTFTPVSSTTMTNDYNLFFFGADGTFYYADSTTPEVVFPPFRAFIRVPKGAMSSPMRSSVRHNDGTTSVVSIDNNTNNRSVSDIYDLNGRVVDVITSGNIYIVNGEKVLK